MTQDVDAADHPAEERSAAPAPAALVAALGELTDLARGKTAKVETKTGGSYTYSYSNLADIMSAVRPVLARHGLAVRSEAQADGQRVEVWTRILHQSGEVWDSPALGMGQPAGAQALGSAITYLRRYSLLAALGLATEDDDGKAASTVTPPRHTGRGRASPTDETARRTRHAMALFGELGLGARDDRLAVTSEILGRQVGSWGELTPVEANRVITELVARRDEEHEADGRAMLWDDADAET